MDPCRGIGTNGVVPFLIHELYTLPTDRPIYLLHTRLLKVVTSTRFLRRVEEILVTQFKHFPKQSGFCLQYEKQLRV